MRKARIVALFNSLIEIEQERFASDLKSTLRKKPASSGCSTDASANAIENTLFVGNTLNSFSRTPLHPLSERPAIFVGQLNDSSTSQSVISCARLDGTPRQQGQGGTSWDERVTAMAPKMARSVRH